MAWVSVRGGTKITVADDWKRNWQESIAVRISALVLWITVPVVVLSTLIYLNGIPDILRKDYTDRADLLAFRVGNALLYTTSLNNPRFRDTLRSIGQDLGFPAVRISIDGDDFVVGNLTPELESVVRGVPAVLPTNPGVASTIQITGYHPPLRVIVQAKRENTLVAIVLMLAAFGLFLMWAIRTIVHTPLRVLVDAAQQVSEGNSTLRLGTDSVDEFGTLARFFNKMLDALMEQQKKVEAALSEAENANRAKSVFLANMSHELRTPLNAIIGYSDMLADEAQELGQEAAIPDLKKIKTAGKHLLDLINNILDISKIEAGKMEIYVETIDVRSMVSDIVATAQPLVDRNDNIFRVDISEQVGTIRADVTKLRQALLNLVGNAAKFTERGVISLRAELGTFNDVDAIRFIVSDTGIGMNEGQLRGAFQAFAQGDGSITRKYGGTGLGLVISRHYVNLMGGDITVRSALGDGAVFTITLPVECKVTDAKQDGDANQRNVA